METTLQPPFLASALICTRYEVGADGRETIENISSTTMLDIDITQGVGLAAEGSPRYFILSFKSGGVPSTHELVVTFESPSGRRVELLRRPLELNVDGANSRMEIGGLRVSEEGMHFFDAFVDGRHLARAPYSVHRLQLGKA